MLLWWGRGEAGGLVAARFALSKGGFQSLTQQLYKAPSQHCRESLSLVLPRNSLMALLDNCSGLYHILAFGSLQIVPLLSFSRVSLFTSSGEDSFWVAGGRRQHPSAGSLEDWMAKTGPGFPAPTFPVIGGDFQPLALDCSLKRMLGHLYSKSYSSAKIRFL